ncbi:MAG: hypothetical protein ACE5H4_07135 [Candidatus Thorarchaeota archaeon]
MAKKTRAFALTTALLLLFIVSVAQAIEITSANIEATIDLDPNTLNSKSRGRWITCYIELPGVYSVEDIETATVLLDDVIPAEQHPTEIGDHDNDGIADLMLKFSRQDLIDYLNNQRGHIDLVVSGELANNIVFLGSDTIRVI